MKFSFMSFSCPEASLNELLDYAKRFGYEGVEPRAQAGHKHGVESEAGPAKRKEIRQVFVDSGIECACIATSLSYCFTDKAKRQAQVELTGRFIDLARDLGCRRIRVFGGMPDKEISTDEAIRIVGSALSEVKEAAEQSRIFVCVETHDFFSRADTAAKAVRLANSPYIRINWDIMHPFTQRMTIEEAFEEVKDLVEHCHVHDGTYDEKKNPELALMGQGVIPYRTALQLLKSINYQGFLSGEYIQAWKPEEVLPHDLQVLKTYLV